MGYVEGQMDHGKKILSGGAPRAETRLSSDELRHSTDDYLTRKKRIMDKTYLNSQHQHPNQTRVEQSEEDIWQKYLPTQTVSARMLHRSAPPRILLMNMQLYAQTTPPFLTKVQYSRSSRSRMTRSKSSKISWITFGPPETSHISAGKQLWPLSQTKEAPHWPSELQINRTNQLPVKDPGVHQHPIYLLSGKIWYIRQKPVWPQDALQYHGPHNVLREISPGCLCPETTGGSSFVDPRKAYDTTLQYCINQDMHRVGLREWVHVFVSGPTQFESEWAPNSLMNSTQKKVLQLVVHWLD